MKSEYIHSGHNVSKLMYHIVFPTKYRRIVISEKVDEVIVGYDVYVLNRNTRPQVEGVTLIEADRHDIGSKLSGLFFDVIIDVTAYSGSDIRNERDYYRGVFR